MSSKRASMLARQALSLKPTRGSGQSMVIGRGRGLASAATLDPASAQEQQSVSPPIPSDRPSSRSGSLTPEDAQAFFSDLFALPPSKSFPPSLALRMLTHKSYRATNILGLRRDPSSPSVPEESFGGASHNERLAFMGKRCFESYLMMFLHGQQQEVTGGRGVLEAFVQGLTLEEKVSRMGHVLNLGREVGGAWDVGSVVRWQPNLTAQTDVDARGSGLLKVSGEVTQAVLGGALMQFGSAASQRLFHIHVLPHLSRQLRSEALQEAAEGAKVKAQREAAGGIVLQ